MDQYPPLYPDAKMENKIPESIASPKITIPEGNLLNPSATASSPEKFPQPSSPFDVFSNKKQESPKFSLGIVGKSPTRPSPSKRSSQGIKDFKNFLLPSEILNPQNPITPSLFSKLVQPQSANKEETPDQKQLNKPLFQVSPIPYLGSPFAMDSNFQTPNLMTKHEAKLSQNPETSAKEPRQNSEIAKRIFESFVDDVLKDLKIDEDSGKKEEKSKPDVKFFINDVSKRETKEIDSLKEEINRKRNDLKLKKEINRDLSQKHEALQDEVKQIELTSETYRKKHSEFERKIKKSSKTYSQILLPEFEDKEKELHMLGGNRNNLSKILDKRREEEMEKTRRYEDQRRILSDKKRENEDLSEENEKIENLNQTIKHEINELKPENNEISFKYCWVQHQNKDIDSKYRSYEAEIEKVKDEIRKIEDDIKATKSNSVTNKSNMTALEQEINSVLTTSDRKSYLISDSSNNIQTIPKIRRLRSKHLSTKQEIIKTPINPSNLIALQKLSIYLLVVLIIIVIFK